MTTVSDSVEQYHTLTERLGRNGACSAMQSTSSATPEVCPKTVFEGRLGYYIDAIGYVLVSSFLLRRVRPQRGLNLGGLP